MIPTVIAQGFSSGMLRCGGGYTRYISLKKPSCATESELTDDDVIIRDDGEEIIGFTILHVSKREHDQAIEC